VEKKSRDWNKDSIQNNFDVAIVFLAVLKSPIPPTTSDLPGNNRGVDSGDCWLIEILG